MIVVANASGTGIFALHEDGQQVLALVLASLETGAYAGLRVYSYAGILGANDPLPATGLTWLNAPQTLAGYANAARKALSEGPGPGQFGRILQVTIASGTYPVPIDATTRSSLGDAAFETTLTNGDQYTIESWLLPTGQFISLDAPSIMTFAKACSAAFQALFNAQKQAVAGIVAGTITTKAQVDAILAASAPAGSTGG
ncbi:hypothetical protein FVE89_10680 [Methylobacterium sp. 2A]|jgi:hypothetical protein|uniref:hypothetical protein n=1 Tax=Methylobacterium sp. 2A TaxID=2603816 RepID=UPI0013521624|nr:hypothetical protein [Methylobacterium sp. 2A]MWV22455.1 hypothetical protein [Methylobacterium sp. 2A]